jgi:N-acyl-D-amino-acid deacylase
VLEEVLSRDYCLFESDAVLRSSGYPNPAALGTFPKLLGDFVRTRGCFSLENAIHRMTGASAERFGLDDRGLLQPGKAADVVLFDAETISDTTPVDSSPPARPTGVEHLFVNGEHVVAESIAVADSRAGRVLRS